MNSDKSMNLNEKWNDLIIAFSPSQFESLCYDLINAMDQYKYLTWRKGGSDSGRDLEATLIRDNPDGFTESSEKWFFECKKYSSGINVTNIANKISWAVNLKADYLVFMSNSYLTNQCRDYCKGEMERDKLKIVEWTDLLFRDILFKYPGICELYFHMLPPRQDWQEPSLKEEAKIKIGDIEFGNISKEAAIKMIETAYHIIQKMKLSDAPKENVELFDIEKDIINLTNEKEKEFSDIFKINVPNPDFYFELALANYYMGTNEESKNYFQKFLDQIEMLSTFRKNELGEDFELDFDHLKFLYNMRNEFLNLFEFFEDSSPSCSIYDLSLKAKDRTVEIKSIYQWFSWDGESIMCLDMNNPTIPIEITTTEEQNEQLKEKLFEATIYYMSINDFMTHITFKEIHNIY